MWSYLVHIVSVVQTIGLTLEDSVERAALAALRGHEDAVHEQSVLGDYC